MSHSMTKLFILIAYSTQETIAINKLRKTKELHFLKCKMVNSLVILVNLIFTLKTKSNANPADPFLA